MATKKAKTRKPAGRRPSSGKSGHGPRPAPNAKSPQRDSQTQRHRWTFLTNHAHVLILLHADPTLVLREIAGRVGITERAIQQILHDLEDEGFIERKKIGRQNHYRVLPDQPLRHPVESHCQVSDLLSLVVNHPRASVNERLAR